MNAPTETIRDSFNYFKLFRQAEGLSPRTIENYEYILRTLMRSPKGISPDTQMGDISDEMLYRHITSLSSGGHGGKHMTAAAVSSHVRSLRAFFNWAWRENYTDTKLLENLRPPKPDHREIIPLTDSEIVRLIDGARNSPRDLAAVTLMLDTGLRLQETVDSTVRNLNLDTGLLKVFGKGRKERFVRIGDHTLLNLVRYFRSDGIDRNAGDSHIILSVTGNTLTKNGLGQIFKRLRKPTGIQRLHPHLLRHTFATRYLQSGGNALALKQLLGHSSLKMTDRYIHMAAVDAAMNSKAPTLLDRVMNSNAGDYLT